jgi:tetratricopeptide (TPR) repeat protein
LAEALAHYSQALIAEATLGGADSSLRHTRLAVGKDPAYLPLAVKVAVGHLVRKENDQALRVLHRAMAHHPDSPEVHLLLGVVYQLIDNTEMAASEFREAIRLAPDRPDVYMRLASLYAAEGRLRKVGAILEEALTRCRNRAVLFEFCDNMGRLYLKGDDPRTALLFFDLLRAGKPDNADAREMTARCYLLLGKTRQAMVLLRELERAQPENAGILLLLGEVCEAREDLASAEDYYDRAVRVTPGDVRAWVKLAYFRGQTDPDGAVKTLQEGVARNPDDFNFRVFLGIFFSSRKEFEAAMAEFAAVERAAEKQPEIVAILQPQFYFRYGAACEQAGHIQEAERLLERCIALDPEFAQALNYLAYMWAVKKVDLDKAQDYVERALAIEPDEGAFLDTLGWVYYQKGAYKEALTYLEKAVARMPDDSTVTEHVGDVWAALENPRQARRFWKLSLKQDPLNIGVRKKLNSLEAK